MSCLFPSSSESCADFITRYYTAPSDFVQMAGTDCIDFVSDQFAIVHLPLSSDDPLFTSTSAFSAIPELYSLLDLSSMDASGIVQTSEIPALDNNGRGVMIGIIDTGIDYRDPIFQNRDKTTRILGIWDQTHGNGTAVSENTFRSTYGTQYTKSQIDEALRSDSPLSIVPSIDEQGHGTALASIAAGGADETNGFLGAAPECYLGVVRLKPAKSYLRDFFLVDEKAEAYQENDIMMGITYLFALARQYNTPLVILLGLGTNSGSHTGTSALGTYIDQMSSYNGTAFVIAAGNETGYDHHYRGSTTPANPSHQVEIRVDDPVNGFSMELWGQDVDVYSIGILSPTGQVIRPRTIRSNQSETIRFLVENTTITIYSRITAAESASQLIFLRFQDPLPGIWTLVITNQMDISGTFHLWLPCRGFIPESVGFLRSDPDTIVTGPGNARFPITVGAYDHNTGGIYIHSSRGFSRSGQIKPDLAAPGVSILAASLRPGSYTRITGTSAAAAHVAGAAAILLSWGILEGNDPYMNSSTIKTYLIRGADRIPARTYPNREFGYGTLNLYQTFLRLRV